MPTVLRIGAYRFFFYAGDGKEPPHIHVERDDCSAKYWLEPVRLAQSKGFRAREITRLQRLVHEHREQLIKCWNDYFDR